MIIVTKDGVVTSELNFRTMNPNVSFPAILKPTDIEPFGMQALVEVAPPPSSRFIRVQEGAPALIDDVWTQTWVQISMEVLSARTQLIGELAAQRWMAQERSVTVDGVTIAADVASLTLLNSSISFLNGSMNEIVNFKAQSGWTQLGLTQLQELANTIHVQYQKCFANEYAHTQNINALTTTEAVDAYDITTGW